MKGLLRRMLGAALLRSHSFEEVEADPRALRQAGLVVALACAAIAGATWLQGHAAGLSERRLAFQVLVAGLLPAVGWLFGSALVYMVGSSFLRGPHTLTDYPEVLRTTGFALAPGILRGLSWLPPAPLGLALDHAATLWMLVAGVVAVRQALDFSTRAAVGTCVSAAMLLWLLMWGLSVAPIPL